MDCLDIDWDAPAVDLIIAKISKQYKTIRLFAIDLSLTQSGT